MIRPLEQRHGTQALGAGRAGRWACWRWARRQGARGRRLGAQGARWEGRHDMGARSAGGSASGRRRCRQLGAAGVGSAEQAAAGARGARQAGRRHAGRARPRRWACGLATGCALGALGLFSIRFDSLLFLSRFLDIVREPGSWTLLITKFFEKKKFIKLNKNKIKSNKI